MPMASASAQPIGTLSQMPVNPSGVAESRWASATRVPSEAMVRMTDIMNFSFFLSIDFTFVFRQISCFRFCIPDLSISDNFLAFFYCNLSRSEIY